MEAPWARLDRVRAQKAAQGWIQIARLQVPKAGLLGVVLAGEAKAAGHTALGADVAKDAIVGRARRGAAAVYQATHDCNASVNR
jgi:hypothetical protein